MLLCQFESSAKIRPYESNQLLPGTHSTLSSLIRDAMLRTKEWEAQRTEQLETEYDQIRQLLLNFSARKAKQVRGHFAFPIL